MNLALAQSTDLQKSRNVNQKEHKLLLLCYAVSCVFHNEDDNKGDLEASRSKRMGIFYSYCDLIGPIKIHPIVIGHLRTPYAIRLHFQTTGTDTMKTEIYISIRH